jgi:hypothetical protein
LKFVAGLAFLMSILPASAQYAGPAILSRGEAPAALSSANISFRPFAELSGVYDTGLAAVSVNTQGQLANAASSGLTVAWGVDGSHAWRHTKLGLEYRGSLSHYTKTTFYDSTSQTVFLGFSHQFSPHATLVLRESAGTFSRDFGLAGLNQTVPYDPASSYIPTTDFFDNRTTYLTSQADFTYQRTRRLSFDFGGDAFLTRYRSTALTGIFGQAARADAQYRISRRTTIGGGYQYARYAYAHGSGGTDIHAFMGSYSMRLSRTVEITGFAGVLRAESKFLQTVAIDPAIAALLGITSARQIVHNIRTISYGSGRISKRYAKGIVYLSGGRSVTPGNGLFLTSYTTTITGGYTYTGFRRWSFNVNGGYASANAVGIIAGRYDTTTGSLSFSRYLTRSLHLITAFSARNYGSADYAGYNRPIYSVRVGIGFAPGDVPLRIW